MVGFWYKTAADFAPSAAAGCTIQSGIAPISVPFAPTAGEWKLQTIGVPVAAGTSSLQLTIANPGTKDVLLDSVYVAPLVGGLRARTYDATTQDISSTMDLGGRTKWICYDAFRRSTLHVGPGGRPNELAQRFFSRQGSPDGMFQPGSPNAELTLHPANGGSVEAFLDGGAWQQAWQPSNLANWQAAGGALTHVGGSTDSIACQATIPSTWALYFEVAAGSAPPSLTITAGNVSVSWTGSAYACTAAGARSHPWPHHP